MTKQIKKNAHTFYVKDSYIVSGWCDKGFFEDQINNGKWEEDTFVVLDKFANKNKVYIDVGAWIGPTVLYASPNFSKVLCFEPDPVAINYLEDNLVLNPDMNNISVVKKGLYNDEGEALFGGTWNLGNSEATFLVNFPFFSFNAGQPSQRGDKISRSSNIISVQTTTLENVLEEHCMGGEEVGLIKIDIEGGEYVVIPAISEFLKKYKPPLYISLHYCYLSDNQVFGILDILFDVYPCCLKEGAKHQVSKEECKNKRLKSLLFKNNDV